VVSLTPGERKDLDVNSELFGGGVLLAGAILLLVVPIMSPTRLLFGLVVVRSLTDVGAAAGTGSLMPSSLLSAGIGVIALVLALVPARTRISPRLHLPIAVTLLVLALGSWVSYRTLGFNMGAIRQTVLLASIVAVFVLAFRCGMERRDMALKQMLWTPLPSAVISVAGFFLLMPALVSSGQRISGTFAHPNTAGAFFGIAVLVVLCVSWQLSYRPGLLVAAAAIAGLAMTGSIGAWAGLIAAALVFVVFTPKLDSSRKVVLIFLGIAAGAAAVLFAGAPERLAEFDGLNASAAINAGESTNSLEWRFVNWTLLLQLWAQRPWLGYGLGSTTTIVMPLGAPPHSLPVQLLVELGVVGAAVVALLVAGACAYIFRAIRRGRWEGALLLAMGAFVLVNGSESNLLNYTPAMYLLALASGILCASLRQPEARPWLPVRDPGMARVPSAPQLPAAVPGAGGDLK
jgi:O-antigen ligase